ncbi:MAG: response regulator, partial [Oleiphilaceae bacterium]|nr:response regulator [Oleiphilaceae bacterium]
MISTDFPLMRVLVVDDDRFMRDLVKMTLEQLNVGQVQVASSGAEAISRIKQSSRAFDILLCDLQMPGMDGLELLRHLGQLQFK